MPTHLYLIKQANVKCQVPESASNDVSTTSGI